jgi:hypothetical protein
MFVADKPDASSPSSPSSAGRKSPVESPRKYKTAYHHQSEGFSAARPEIIRPITRDG